MTARTPKLAEVTVSETRGVRYLHLDTPWIQGAMRIARPDAIELEYVRRMMVWLLLRDEADATDGHAVQLGLGAAAITRFCAGPLDMQTTAVELNRRVIDACRTWFRLPIESARFRVVEADAAAFAADPAHRGIAAALCVDLYDHEAASPVLDSAAFYVDCRALLADGGAMTVNLFGRDSSFPRSFARIVAVFGAGNVLAFPPTAEGNTIVAAMKHVTLPDRDVLARRAENIETRWGLPARRWLRMLRPLPGPSSDTRPAPVPNLPPA